MGIPSYLVANTLNTSVAQRLIRKLCSCKVETDFDEKEYPQRYKPSKKITKHYVPTGCEQCHYTGYKGRLAIYEVIPVDTELSEAIKDKRFDVSSELQERNIKQLSENAFELFEKGETTLEEIYPMLVNY